MAYRKQTPDGDSTGSSHKSNANTSTTPRRLKRGLKNQSSSVSRSETDSQGIFIFPYLFWISSLNKHFCL